MSIPTKNLRADAARKNLGKASLALCCLWLAAPAARPAEPAPAALPASQGEKPLKASRPVFVSVRNVAGARLAGLEAVFEASLSSRISADCGIRLISAADAVRRLSASENRPAELGADKVDRAFDDSSSALRLAQTLAADGLLSVSLVSYGNDSSEYSGNGIRTLNDRHILRVAWKLLDASRGSGVLAGTATATRTVRRTEGLVEIPGDLMNGLLDDAAGKVANELVSRLGAQPESVAALLSEKAARVKFSVGVSGRSLFFPEITADKNGVLQVGQSKLPVQLDGVVVELDGAALGTAPFAKPVEVLPGLHKLRLSREGFTPWQGVVNVYDGFVFNAALEPDELGLRRWREQSAFIQELKSGERLDAARAGFLRAQAENLKNYGFKVDLKVDAKELPANTGPVVNQIGVR